MVWGWGDLLPPPRPVSGGDWRDWDVYRSTTAPCAGGGGCSPQGWDNPPPPTPSSTARYGMLKSSQALSCRQRTRSLCFRQVVEETRGQRQEGE